MPDDEYNRQLNDVLDKECLCVGLSNAAVKKYEVKPFKGLSGINICPGPNIAYFSEVVSLQKMVDHIYGRVNILPGNNRPHMFIKELMIYVDYWKELVAEAKEAIDNKKKSYIENFHHNLLEGIAHYRTLTDKINSEVTTLKDKLHEGLITAETQLEETFRKFMEKTMVPA